MGTHTLVTRILRATALGLALLPAGCLNLGGSDPPIRRHSIDLLERPASVEGNDDLTMGVRAFAARQRYEPRVLFIDESAGTVEYLEFDRWLDEPQEAVTDVIRESVAMSGAFEFVAPATSGMQPDLMLDGTLLGCDLVATAEGPWVARLSVRLDLTVLEDGTMITSGIRQAEQPLPGASPDGLGLAMSRCLQEVVDQLLGRVAELRAAGALKLPADDR